jgi:hypothetical protein
MVQERLKETNWKQNGLTKRTLKEKIKRPKTQVSEALRDYANLATHGLDMHDRKAAALQNIKDKLTRCRQDHGPTASSSPISPWWSRTSTPRCKT